MYGAGRNRARKPNGSRIAAAFEDDDDEDAAQTDDEGLNMLGDGGRNDEGPDDPDYGEDDGFGHDGGDGGVMDEDEGAFY